MFFLSVFKTFWGDWGIINNEKRQRMDDDHVQFSPVRRSAKTCTFLCIYAPNCSETRCACAPTLSDGSVSEQNWKIQLRRISLLKQILTRQRSNTSHPGGGRCSKGLPQSLLQRLKMSFTQLIEQMWISTCSTGVQYAVTVIDRHGEQRVLLHSNMKVMLSYMYENKYAPHNWLVGGSHADDVNRVPPW